MIKIIRLLYLRVAFLIFALHAPKGAPLTKPLTGLEAEKSLCKIKCKQADCQ